MAYAEVDAVTEISDEESWRLMTGAQLGRLATSIGDDIEVFPVNYVVDHRSIVFRTAEGSKLFELTVNSRVAFEVDESAGDGGWSVVLHGEAKVLDDEDEIAAAQTLPLRPWVPTIKTIFVRVLPQRVSGRRFRFGEEPEAWHL